MDLDIPFPDPPPSTRSNFDHDMCLGSFLFQITNRDSCTTSKKKANHQSFVFTHSLGFFQTYSLREPLSLSFKLYRQTSHTHPPHVIDAFAVRQWFGVRLRWRFREQMSA